MPGVYTWTVAPSAGDLIRVLVEHAYLIAALVLLSGLLFGSKMLEE